MFKQKMTTLFFIVSLACWASVISYGQKKIISSERSYIKINNVASTLTDNDKTTSLPFIVVYPKFSTQKKFESLVGQINFIGKLTDTTGVVAAYINETKAELSSDGIFWEAMNLLDGENTITITIIYRSGKVVKVDFYINYVAFESDNFFRNSFQEKRKPPFIKAIQNPGLQTTVFKL